MSRLFRSQTQSLSLVLCTLLVLLGFGSRGLFVDAQHLADWLPGREDFPALSACSCGCCVAQALEKKEREVLCVPLHHGQANSHGNFVQCNPIIGEHHTLC